MNVLKDKMQRRDFLRTLAKLGLTTAFTSQFMLSPSVFAQTRTAKRFVMVYYPNGCVQSRWHAYNLGALGEKSFETSPLQPLSRHANKIVPIKNLTYVGHGGSESHPESCKGVFSGGKGGASFDTTLGEALTGARKANLHLGVWSSRAKDASHMPFADRNGAKILVPDNPQLIYDNQIADFVSEEKSPDTELRLRVLETLRANLNVLAKYPLHATQQGKLLSHERSLDLYKSALESNIGVGGGFSRPTVGMSGVNAEAEDVAKAQMRNIAMSFQANITRTATLQFMGAQDESLKINFPSIREYMGVYGRLPQLDHNETKSHVSSHNDKDAAVNYLFDSQTRWYNMMVAYLMDELANRTDPAYGGTLLDHTLILVMSECGGGSHQQENPGIYVAGGAGGAIASGRAIDAGGAGMSNLYLEIAKAFGLNWTTYGNNTNGGTVPGFRV